MLRHNLSHYDVQYLKKAFHLETAELIKVNGIFLNQLQDQMKKANLGAVRKKIEDNCRRWSARRLCLLGKILILKTFGISQAIYLMQCLPINDADVKSLNSVLYKFLWNRHFEDAKALDRLSREIINAPI